MKQEAAEQESFFATEEEFQEAGRKVRELTGRDISEAKVATGSRNITYVFSESVKPYVIRITPAWVKPLKTVYSEMMFRTICASISIRSAIRYRLTTG